VPTRAPRRSATTCWCACRASIATSVAPCRRAHQQVVAERLGARVGTDGLYDVVVEAAGTPASLARSIELVAPGGSVVVVGVYPGPVEVDWMTLFQREGRLVPSLGYCRHDDRREMEDAAAMLAADPGITDALITHRFPLADAAEAFRVAGDRAASSIRVVLEP